MDINIKYQLFEYLSEFISDNKKSLINNIIQNRTRFLTLVLEDIYQPHNASAVLRTCDCFGIQDVHIIENKNKYNVNPDVALGASKWISIHKYNSQENNTINCINKLKEQGYRIVATMPDEKYPTLEELDINRKIALIFGTEMEGLSDNAIKNADEFVRVKMYGFTESLNISVTAALFIHYLSEKIRSSNVTWQLSEEEIIDIKINWSKNVIKKSELIEKEFYNKLKNIKK